MGQALETKQVNALAALTRERSPILPDLPTAHEQGLKDFDAYTWNAVFLPKGTRAALVDRLNQAIRKVMDNPAFRERLHSLGLIVVAPERRSPVSANIRGARDRQMGGTDQGQRREGG